MAQKFGSNFARDMLDRGRRELAGVLYPDSNVAQPMYPLHGSGPARDSPAFDPNRSILNERLDRIDRDGPADPGRDGPDREGPDLDR